MLLHLEEKTSCHQERIAAKNGKDEVYVHAKLNGVFFTWNTCTQVVKEHGMTHQYNLGNFKIKH